MKAEDKYAHVFLARIRDGQLRIAPDGTLWSIGHKNSWSGEIVPHTPRKLTTHCDLGYVRIAAADFSTGRMVNMPAHRLVYLVLVGPIPKGYTINHKNGIKDDNQPENLEAVSQQENCAHAYRELRHLRSSRLSVETARRVFSALAEGKTIREVSEALGVKRHTVRAIRDRRTWATATGDMMEAPIPDPSKLT